MRRSLGAILAGCAILANGCVSLPTQQDRLADLQESRNRSARSAAEIAALEQERLRFLEELAVIRTGRETALSDLELHRHYLANEQQILNQIESRFTALRNDYQQIHRERDRLQQQVEDLTVQLEEVREDLADSQQSLKDSQARIRDLEQERETAKAALAEARDQARGLEAALAADEESWTRLRRALSKVENIDTRPSQPPAQGD